MSYSEVTCFNRNREGRCMAYTRAECSWECPARISNIDQKINLLHCLLARLQSKKDIRKMAEELEDAYQVKRAIQEGKMEGWMSCYIEDLHRGSGGGQSESDSNRKTGLKQLMKDNRSVGVKPTKAQQEEYKEALHQFEEEIGEKMEKLGRTSLSHSKVNSYTGLPICFVDDGVGTCRGQRSKHGTLAKDCKACTYLEERTL